MQARFRPLLLLLLVPSLAACGASSSSAPPASTQAPTTTSAPSFADLVQRIKSSVIRIEVTDCADSAIGTGFLVKPRLVATVEHVVDGALKIKLKRNGELLGTATVIGLDKDRDLALLRTSVPIDGYDFGFAGRAPRLGEDVAAMGFPLGLPLTVTRGSVSGLGRTLPIEGVKRRRMVQTDAAVNPGNSGGPLLSAETGEVVGLVDLGTNQANSVAFAVSAEVAAPLLKAWSVAPQPPAREVCSRQNPSTGGSASNASSGVSSTDYVNAVDQALIGSARTRGNYVHQPGRVRQGDASVRGCHPTRRYVTAKSGSQSPPSGRFSQRPLMRSWSADTTAANRCENSLSSRQIFHAPLSSVIA